MATAARGSATDIQLRIKRLSKKVGLKWDVWQYFFRHSALTNPTKAFTEARLERYAG